MNCCVRPEGWFPIPGVGGYEASNLGNIRRLAGRGCKEDRILKYRPQFYIGAEPPWYLRPWRRGEAARSVIVWARAVCAAMHGEPPIPGLIVHHKDEDNQNNRADNLEWSTVARHVRHHRRKKGTEKC